MKTYLLPSIYQPAKKMDVLHYWKELRPIIASDGCHNKQYLSVLDEHGNILLANARMKKELHLKNPRQGKNNFFDLLHPVHIENFRKALQDSSKNNNPYSIELFLKNGHYNYMEWQVTSLPGKATGIKNFVCRGTLSKRVTPETKRNNSITNTDASIFQAFMKNTPNLNWILDKDAKLVYANQVFLQHFQLTEAVLDKEIAYQLPLSVVDALIEKHQRVLQTGIPIETIEKGKLADGTKTIFKISIFPIQDTAGNKLVGGIAVNYADKYYTEKKLAAATERLKHITYVTSDAIWEWDMLTGNMFRNEKLTDMIGYQPEDLKGLTWWLSRVHPEERDQLNEILKEVTEKSLQSWESEYRFLCADGEYKHMLDRGFVIYEKGMPVKMIGSLSDISNEKLMGNLLLEEKLRQFKLISENAMRVQEQERTRLGREMHDNVNQILSTIKMFVGLLTPANDEEAEIKEKTIEYSMLAIEEIRKLSREMVTPQLDGGGLTDNIHKLITDIELSSPIRIKFTYDSENGLLSPGKKLTLFRILQEQLKNILKYSKAKQVEIFLQTKNEQVQLIIKDNGVGFDMKKTNIGIGLASIKDRAKFYNGKTEIESAPGNGCQVSVNIPLLD